ncbi:MAG: tetratricopeptide repeat protein [bacterium]|nr:tetratricopeptide repeat protein [bacterium]
MKKPPKKFSQSKTVFQKPQPSTFAKASADKQKSPSNSRKIPEAMQSGWVRLSTLHTHWEVIFVSFICGVLLMGIIMMGFRLKDRFDELRRREVMQTRLEEKKAYWKEIVKKYPDYKDAYYQLAIYSYTLGQKNEAHEAIEKVLQIDPNDADGREFAKKISG